MEDIEHSKSNILYPKTVRSRNHWILSVEWWLLNVSKFILILAIRLYRLTISPALTFLFGSTSGCRFTPTCSQYAMDAIREHGAIAGTVLAGKRIGHCHPLGKCG